MPRSTKTVAAPKPAAAAPKRGKSGGAKAVKATKATKAAAVKTTKAAAAKKAPAARSRAASAAPAAGRAGATARKATKSARPAKAGAAVLDKFLEEQRTLLQQEREGYVHQAESLRMEAERLAEEMEPGDIQFDEESGEGATINVERERDLALSAQARGAVDEIDRALEKIVTGKYGICEQCGQPIPKARLKALPYASLCVACKSGGLSRR